MPTPELTAPIVATLRRIRLVAALSEYDIHARIAEELTAAGISFAREVSIGPRMRVDFLADGIGIEVKKGKPARRLVVEQAARYLETDQLSALILVVERSMQGAPMEINSKPVVYIALNKNWGISL